MPYTADGASQQDCALRNRYAFLHSKRNMPFKSARESPQKAPRALDPAAAFMIG
jgi:hypothetical protein